MQKCGDNEGKEIINEVVQKNYVGFYGYFKIFVDKEMGKVLDVFDVKGLIEDILIICIVDYGELCFFYGGL